MTENISYRDCYKVFDINERVFRKETVSMIGANGQLRLDWFSIALLLIAYSCQSVIVRWCWSPVSLFPVLCSMFYASTHVMRGTYMCKQCICTIGWFFSTGPAQKVFKKAKYWTTNLLCFPLLGILSSSTFWVGLVEKLSLYIIQYTPCITLQPSTHHRL